MTHIDTICKVGVVSKAMDKVNGVNVVFLDSVVRVVVSLNNSHTYVYQVFYVATIDTLIKVIPRQRKACSNLCCYLSLCLDIGFKENLSFLKCFWKAVWVGSGLQAHFLCFTQNILILYQRTDTSFLLVLLALGERVNSLYVWIRFSGQNLIDYNLYKLWNDWNWRPVQRQQSTIPVIRV